MNTDDTDHSEASLELICVIRVHPRPTILLGVLTLAALASWRSSLLPVAQERCHQLIHPLRLIVLHPVRRVGEALDAHVRRPPLRRARHLRHHVPVALAPD